MRLDRIAGERGLVTVWRPFLLGPLFKDQGWNTSPFKLYPAKGRYMWRDLERRCTALGLPFAMPDLDRFPAFTVQAARMALVALDQPRGRAFCRRVFQANFAERQSIDDPAVLSGLALEVGMALDLENAAETPAVKAQLRANVEEARARGLFGAPSFFVGEELFWGDDRLEDALDWAAKDGA